MEAFIYHLGAWVFAFSCARFVFAVVDRIEGGEKH